MNHERMYSIILGPHVSEKTTLLGEENQYTFKVATDATKPEIRKAVETLFSVIVQDLQVLNVKGKTKRSAIGKLRRRPSWKKAYVRLEAGHEIDFADFG
ncbi:MAG: 50S ribosomal protein L23 [Gammaproteobacteria bacterium]|jgi:large subunit ribosomal protein L23|nr:50S ribosomal protein L23 [Gammaproteobacteria bacterium]MDP6094742.1 50S ribosomal protein L23 [Gammaproteobacteria bacterium]HJO12964.1 50S ribosomal protein L23 [Gammaproteobacteria bacterium]|tara:strand:+ start:96 stop:392 length:297 start_codon:yes stop_codon:yes gene_type:complete